MKIQFCCGGNRLEGFVNHDAEVDITRRLPYEDNSVNFVFCEHGAEHISGPQALAFFDEVYRIIKPGGTFRLCIPVLDRLDWEHARDIIRGHGHLTIWNPELVMRVLWCAGFSEEKMGEVDFDPTMDSHWKVIGKDKDNRETCRIEATK
jgi:predicted SAM-dependent methyltransferase